MFLSLVRLTCVITTRGNFISIGANEADANNADANDAGAIGVGANGAGAIGIRGHEAQANNAGALV